MSQYECSKRQRRGFPAVCSCDGGNLTLILGRYAGSMGIGGAPRVLFFASRDIAAGEELSWGYGAPNARPTGRRCCCGTQACQGFMPHEDV
jgi:hypothetical protein